MPSLPTPRASNSGVPIRVPMPFCSVIEQQRASIWVNEADRSDVERLHLTLGNYRSAIRDCVLSRKCKSDHLKAYVKGRYRECKRDYEQFILHLGAEASMKLEKYKDVQAWCSAALTVSFSSVLIERNLRLTFFSLTHIFVLFLTVLKQWCQTNRITRSCCNPSSEWRQREKSEQSLNRFLLERNGTKWAETTESRKKTEGRTEENSPGCSSKLIPRTCCSRRESLCQGTAYSSSRRSQYQHLRSQCQSSWKFDAIEWHRSNIDISRGVSLSWIRTDRLYQRIPWAYQVELHLQKCLLSNVHP